MKSSDLVKRAIHWEYPERTPVMHHTQKGALHEHGEELYRIWSEYPKDFGAITPGNTPIEHPDPKDRKNGRYYREFIDAWKVHWIETTFGQMGHVVDYLVKTADDLRKVCPPEIPRFGSHQYNLDQITIESNRQRGHYNRCGWIPLFEVMHALRNPESLFVDLADDDELVATLADLIVEHQMGMVRYYLDLGADGIQFADDWGSQLNTLISLDMWRSFFKPRYRRLFLEVLGRGRDVFFHSCGYIFPLVDELRDLGVKVLWPQPGPNDQAALAEKLRDNRMTIMWDIDRQHLMPFGKPGEIHDVVRDAWLLFGDSRGGLIWYGELFPGYPLENIEALYASFYQYIGSERPHG